MMVLRKMNIDLVDFPALLYPPMIHRAPLIPIMPIFFTCCIVGVYLTVVPSDVWCSIFW